jgi:putative RNA 2'-phosphotransferase
MRKELVRTSKFLSLVLRHDPGKIGLVLDPGGWTEIADLLHRAEVAGHPIPRDLLDEAVATNDKRRFSTSRPTASG